jgi:hypothetical protein
MLRAVTVHPAGHYLAPFSKIAPEGLDILVIDKRYFVRTKFTVSFSLKFSVLQRYAPFILKILTHYINFKTAQVP